MFDADNHFYEPKEALTKFLPDHRKNVIDYIEVRGRTKIMVRNQVSDYIPNPTFAVVARPGPRRSTSGRQRRQELPRGHGEADEGDSGIPRSGRFDRHSFGRPVGSYQALKHKYADLKIWFEACRATTNAAAAQVASRSPGADMSVSVAKSYVGEHAPGMLQDCIQLHGGIGVTWEHDLHLFQRRVTLDRSMFGTPEDHNLRVYALTEQGPRARLGLEADS